MSRKISCCSRTIFEVWNYTTILDIRCYFAVPYHMKYSLQVSETLYIYLNKIYRKSELRTGKNEEFLSNMISKDRHQRARELKVI